MPWRQLRWTAARGVGGCASGWRRRALAGEAKEAKESQETANLLATTRCPKSSGACVVRSLGRHAPRSFGAGDRSRARGRLFGLWVLFCLPRPCSTKRAARTAVNARAAVNAVRSERTSAGAGHREQQLRRRRTAARLIAAVVGVEVVLFWVGDCKEDSRGLQGDGQPHGHYTRPQKAWGHAWRDHLRLHAPKPLRPWR